MTKVKPVNSLMDLYSKAKTDSNYEKLAIKSATNLGSYGNNISSAMDYLKMVADETSEEGVVDEINFCIDCL